MAIPSPAQLRQELDTDPKSLGYKDQQGNFKPTRDILYLLTRRPVSYTTKEVPDPPTLDEILSVISDASLAKIPEYAADRIEDVVRARDLQRMRYWLRLVGAKGYITVAEAQQIQALLQRAKTVQEPVYGQARVEELGWEVNVELLNRALGRPENAWG